jgi:5-methyltetrahydropteroyltriglutamate--homocysteine methyltransferase
MQERRTEDKSLFPACSARRPNYVDHPELVAERLLRFAEHRADAKRIMAGSDCGFSTFAGFGAVVPDIVYLKLGAMAEGARLASEKLW